MADTKDKKFDSRTAAAAGAKSKRGASKKTKQWEAFAEHCMTGGLKKYRQELMKLKGKDYIYAFQNQMEFFQPKKSRVEVTGEGGGVIKVQQTYTLPDGTSVIFD